MIPTRLNTSSFQKTALLCGLLWMTGSILAAEKVVHPSPTNEPVLANALRLAADGDTIRLKKGVYQETVVIRNRISLVGEPGAIIDPSESFQPQWQAAATLGKGVYQAAVRQKPQALFLDGRVVAEIDHKLAGFYDRAGINLLHAGVNNRIMGNHVFETFDCINLGDSAVESLDKPLPQPEDGKGTEILGNLIERTRDSGIELGAGCIDVRVHDNVLRQTHGGLRFKLPRVGPVFIYRNVLEGGTPFNIWYSMDDSPAEGYVYHNTIVGGRAGLVYSSFNKGHQIGAPRWHYLNKLVVAERGFFGRSSRNYARKCELARRSTNSLRQSERRSNAGFST